MGHLRTPQIVENCTELNKVSIWWSYESLRFSELFVLNFCCFALYTSRRGRLFYEMFYWNRVLIQSVNSTGVIETLYYVFFVFEHVFLGVIFKEFYLNFINCRKNYKFESILFSLTSVAAAADVCWVNHATLDLKIYF